MRVYFASNGDCRILSGVRADFVCEVLKKWRHISLLIKVLEWNSYIEYDKLKVSLS